MSEERRFGAIAGSLHALGEGKGTVRMESMYATDIDDLWSALTTPDRLSRWLAEVHGDMLRGGAFSIRFTSGWDGVGRVDVCDAPGRLVVTMMPGTAEETVIEAVLTAVGDSTRLVIEERGIPLAEISAHGAGWQAHVEDLQSHLGDFARVAWKSRWVDLRPHYEQLAVDIRDRPAG